MTKPELSGKRSLAFSAWIKEKLPDSQTGLCVGNQDWVFWNWKTCQLMLAEEKTHNGRLSEWMKRLMKEIVDPALKEYCVKNRIDYRGYHLIQFSGTHPDDGMINFDGLQISRNELVKILSFEIYPPSI